jgi:DNA-binding Lrp family transcriptional regulator
MTAIRKGVPEARRQQILNWLEQEGSLSIRELEARLSISHMTVHRDLDKLAKQRLIQKVRSGAILAERQEEQHKICAMCAGRISRRLEFIIMRKGEAQVRACCPHCGILLLSNKVEEESALARDYLYGRMVNVYQAYYVIASDVRLCCVPTVLCFASISDAEKFSVGFSGQVMDFSQALIHLSTSHQHLHR